MCISLLVWWHLVALYYKHGAAVSIRIIIVPSEYASMPGKPIALVQKIDTSLMTLPKAVQG